MKKQLFLISLFSILLFSCQNSVKTSTPSENHDAEHHHEAGKESLNQGAKWTANPETKEGISKMLKLTQDLPGQASLNDYHSLKEKMIVEFDNIIANCTMTGEAHDQLHNYLLPLHQAIDQLGSTDIEVCKAALGELTQHLGEFENFFM